MIKVKLNSDDIKLFNNKLKSFISTLRQDIEKALLASGEEYATKVKAEIGTHDPNSIANVYGESWIPLSEDWLTE